MRITLTLRIPGSRVPAGSTVSAIASFYNDASEPWVLTAPTSARYRLYDPAINADLIAWSSLTPATTNTISLPGTSLTNSCQSQRKVQLIVEADAGLSTQYQDSREFLIEAMPA